MFELGLLGAIFLLQWLAFLPAYYFKTERFYDLVGSLTYITLMVVIIIFTATIDWRSLLIAALVIVWALRLGVFLFLRIHAAGGDSRFEQIKVSPKRFFIAWTIQGVWVAFTVSAALLAMTSGNYSSIGLIDLAGLLLWLTGFGIESVADYQKNLFRKDQLQNKTSDARPFIDTGLWSLCRHPNYCGEIMLWVGIAVLALPVLEGWRLIGLLSPVFVGYLLIRVSGIPLLEIAAEKKWGGRDDYQNYKTTTPRLFPGF